MSPAETSADKAVYDTSVFIAAESGRPVKEHLLPAENVSTVITWAELSAGVLSAPDAAARALRMSILTRLAKAELLGVGLQIEPPQVLCRIFLSWKDAEHAEEDRSRGA